jgi:hypothetical protein
MAAGRSGWLTDLKQDKASLRHIRTRTSLSQNKHSIDTAIQPLPSVIVLSNLVTLTKLGCFI